MKGMKLMGFGMKKSKSGFTLIELLIVMVILAILVGVIVMAVGGVFGQAGEAAYNSSREEMKNAVVSYSVDHSGSFPTTGATKVCDSANLNIVNVSALLTTSGGMLSTWPQGMWHDSVTANGSNFATTTLPTGYTAGHYTWLIDNSGNLYSVCTGTACVNGSSGVDQDSDGFMSVWP